jgi:glucokinase
MTTGTVATIAVGVEVGDRHLRAVAVDDGGDVLATETREDVPIGSAAVQKAVAIAAKAAGISAPSSVGVSAFDPASETVRAAAGSLPVFHAGAAAVAAETWRGAARDTRCAVALIVGDQIAAGVMVDGAVWRGAHGLAGYASWLALNPVERQDYRRLGCFEAEASGPGIARRLAWRVESGDRSSVVARAGGSLTAVTATHVFEAARERDGVAVSVVRDTARYIGMAVANIATVVDPEIVVLCGSVAEAGDLLLEPIRQEALRHVAPGLASALRIELSSLGASAIAIGAARLAAQLQR